jgi:hypothetical protein
MSTIVTSFMESMSRFARVVREMDKESHRGAAVLTLCLLEEVVKSGIAARLVEHGKDMVDTLAPPGNWRVLISNGRALGILTKGEAHALTKLVAIRNKFSHGVAENLRFESPEVANLVKNLPLPPGSTKESISTNTLMQQFLIVSASLYSLLQVRHGTIARILPPSAQMPGWES